MKIEWTSTVWFGSNDETFFCRIQKKYFYLELFFHKYCIQIFVDVEKLKYQNGLKMDTFNYIFYLLVLTIVCCTTVFRLHFLLASFSYGSIQSGPPRFATFASEWVDSRGKRLTHPQKAKQQHKNPFKSQIPKKLYAFLCPANQLFKRTTLWLTSW